MKYVLPLGALLLLLLAAVVHSTSAEPARPMVRPATEAAAAPVPLQPELQQQRPPVREAAVLTVPKGKTSEAPAAPKGVDGMAWRKLSGMLAQQLILTPLQKDPVEQILRDRAEEIRVCHEEIRKAKLLDMRQYEWQVGKMKESWFRKIDGLLDSDQHRRFVSIVEQGFFNDGLGITEEAGMTVLD